MSDEKKEAFLKNRPFRNHPDQDSLFLSAVVGVSYFIGAMVPVLPVFFGAKNMFFSIVSSIAMIVLVSSILSFLSGMDIRKRIALNLGIIAFAVSTTYGIGYLARYFWGINI